jgi:hypothetical protein
MTFDSYDGHPTAAGFVSQLVGDAPAFSLAGFYEALVVGRRCVDEVGNRSRNAVEYVVRLVETGEDVPAVALERSFGQKDGEEVLYRPATRSLTDGVMFSRGTRASDTDGDYVVVFFLGGARERAVILGALAHAGARYAARKADGERRLVVHQGARVEMRDDGSQVSTSPPVEGASSTVEVAANGDVLVSHRSGSRVHLAGDVVKLDGRAAAGVLLGFAAVEAAVRGDSFTSAVSAPMAAAAQVLAAAAAAFGAGILPGSPAAIENPILAPLLETLTTAVVAYLVAVQAALGAVPSTLSAKVKVE